MENGEDFWVQYYNGSAWQTVASYARGTSFNNNTWYVATVTIPRTSYTFPTNAKIRFLCDASDNNDDVYIDQITWRGLASANVQPNRIAVVADAPDRGNDAARLGLNPDGLSLSQNRPNPFAGRTTISFALPTESPVNLSVYDVTGRQVITLVDGTQSAGLHSVELDSRILTPGVYFYRLVADGEAVQRKMVILQ
jgi:hypothetical protein